MIKRLALVTFLAMVSIGIIDLRLGIQKVHAIGTVYIRENGAIDPLTVNFTSSDNITYSFGGNLNVEVVVERSNVIVDGNGYVLQGWGYPSTGIRWQDISNVTVQNLNVRGFYYGILVSHSANNTIEENSFTDNEDCIRLKDSANGNRIVGNRLEDNTYHGIVIENSSDNEVFQNNITTSYHGVYLNDSLDNRVRENILAHNDYGMYAENSTNNVLQQNLVDANDYGIIIYRSSNNTIHQNSIMNNFYGMYFEDSANNRIYHNNFDNSYSQAEFINSVNVWDNGVEGNYWSNYAGTDLIGGSDGVGDEPHVVYAIENQTDRFPLMGPASFFTAGRWNQTAYYVHTVSNSTVSHFSFNEDMGRISFNVTGEDGSVGFCRVAIPKKLLWCENSQDWTVWVNNESVTYRLEEDSDYTYLYFAYSHSSEKAEVKGTHFIPELPSALIIPMFMITAFVIATISRKKTLSKKVKEKMNYGLAESTSFCSQTVIAVGPTTAV